MKSMESNKELNREQSPTGTHTEKSLALKGTKFSILHERKNMVLSSNVNIGTGIRIGKRWDNLHVWAITRTLKFQHGVHSI